MEIHLSKDNVGGGEVRFIRLLFSSLTNIS